MLEERLHLNYFFLYQQIKFKSNELMGKWLDAGEHFGQAAAMLLYGKTQMVDHEELFFDFGNHW